MTDLVSPRNVGSVGRAASRRTAACGVARQRLARPRRPLSTEEFIRHTTRNVPAGSERASLDIVSMYTETPVRQSLEAVLKRARANEAGLAEEFQIDANVLGMLLEECITTYVEFDGVTARQVNGWPMGGPISGVVCEIYVEEVSIEALNRYARSGKSVDELSRYVDDTYLVAEDVELLRRCLERSGPLKWTIERPVDGRLAFLDAMMIEKDGKIRVAHYRKPTACDVYTHETSAHPERYRHAWLEALAWRIFTQVDESERACALRWLRGAARTNGVPAEVVERKLGRTRERVRSRFVVKDAPAWFCGSDRKVYRVTVMDRKGGSARIKYHTAGTHGWEYLDVPTCRLRPYEKAGNRPEPWCRVKAPDEWTAFDPKTQEERKKEEPKLGLVVLQYHPAWEGLRAAMRAADVRVVWKVKTLRDMMLPTLKGRRSESTSEPRGVVYARGCAECAAVYVGETGRKMLERQREHSSAVRNWESNATTNALAHHRATTGHGISEEGVVVLRNYHRKTQRRVAEAVIAHLLRGRRVINGAGEDCPKSLQLKPLSDVWKPFLARKATRLPSRVVMQLTAKQGETVTTASGFGWMVQSIKTRFRSLWVKPAAVPAYKSPEEGKLVPKHHRCAHKQRPGAALRTLI